MKADEGFYAAFSPRRLKQELAEVEDLVLPASASLQGLDVGAAFRLAAALLMLAAVIPGYIVPQVRLVRLQDLALPVSQHFRMLVCRAKSWRRRETPCAVRLHFVPERSDLLVD